MGYIIPNRLQTTGDVQDLTVVAGDIANNTLTGGKLTANARLSSFVYQIEDLGAGADIVGRVIWRTPGYVVSIMRCRIIFETATAGVAGGNELTIAITGPGGAIASSGALAGNQAANTVLDPAVANNTNIVANSNITLDVTQAGVADAGRVSLLIEWETQV